MTLTQAISHFLRYLATERSYSPHTIQSYRYDLTQFLTFTQHTTAPLTDVNRRSCRQYLYHLEQKKYHPKSIARFIASLRSLWQWLQLNSVVPHNPWKDIQLPKQPKTLPTLLSATTLKTFLESFDLSQPQGIRNRMICEFLYGAGLRVSELTQLNIADINLHDCDCRIIGKGKKERIAIFAPITQRCIEAYLSTARPQWTPHPTDAFLVNTKGKRMTPRSVQRIIKEQAQRLDLSDHITPHTLRHAFASDLYNGGADLAVIQELLGHSSITTTEIYTHVSTDQLKERFEKAHPRNNKT